MKRLSMLCGWLSACALVAGCAQTKTVAHEGTRTGAAAATATATRVLQENTRLAHYRLGNGFELIVKPDRRAPTAIQMVWVRVGSIDEDDGTSGISHMLEHMMFKGTARLGPGEFSRRVAELGGRENAFASKDFTGYFEQVPADRLADVMALEADRFENNQWSDEEFQREREVVAEERRSRIDDQPRSKLYEQLLATTYIASPERRPIIGWMDDIARYTADDVRDFHKRWYVPANAVVVVVGNVEPREVLKLAEQHYGGIASAPVPERKITREPAQQGPRRLQMYDRVEQPVVLMAFKVPALRNLVEPTESDREALALMALDGVLDGHDGARLGRQLTRGPHRVADAAGSSTSLSGRSGNGLFFLNGIPAAGHTSADVENALRASVREVAEHGVSAAELQRVITQWTASTVYSQDSMMEQASELGRNWIQGAPLDATERTLALARQVTPAQVQAVAQKYFGDTAMTVAELVPDNTARSSGTTRPLETAEQSGPLQ